MVYARKKRGPTKLIMIFLIGNILLVLLLLAATFLVIQKVLSPRPFGYVDNWKLAFDDEFNGNTLDTTKWSTCLPWYGPRPGCPGADASEQELYLPENVSVSNGTLKLRAEKRDVLYQGKMYSYTSGLISTGGRAGSLPAQFSTTYGYIEMRAKVPKGQGFWPTFWALPVAGNWPPEIDAMELFGNDTTTSQMTYHYTTSSGAVAQSAQQWSGPDFAAGWHVYAVDWEPTAIRWYIDGIERRMAYVDADTITHQPLYILANLAVGGRGPGPPDQTTPFPSTFEIDYIRVWQRDTGGPPLFPLP